MKISNRSQLGVTLIELMIVVAIVAILSAIAYPSYRQFIVRTNRSEAKIALLSVQVAEEKWYLQHSTYTGTLSDLGVAATTPKGNYAISMSGISATGYTATATPAGGQTDDTTCGTYTINQSGDKTPTSAECWK